MLSFIVFTISTIILLVVSGLLLHALIRFRRRTAADPDFRDHPALETVWALIPVVILIALLWLTYLQL